MSVTSRQIPVSASAGAVRPRPRPPGWPAPRAPHRCRVVLPAVRRPAATRRQANALRLPRALFVAATWGHGVPDGRRPANRTVELVEGVDQHLEARTLGRAGPAPRGQADPVAETPAQREEVHLALVPELFGRRIDGLARRCADRSPRPPAPKSWWGRTRRPANSSSGSFRLSALRQSALYSPCWPSPRAACRRTRLAYRGEQEEVAVFSAVHHEGVPTTCARLSPAWRRDRPSLRIPRKSDAVLP